MTNTQILQAALQQSARDSSCCAEDFLSPHSKVVLSHKNNDARRYLQLPFSCDLTSYGKGIVASVAPQLAETVADFIDHYPAVHCFETPNLLVLQRKLQPFDLDICFMAEYFLPDVQMLKPLSCIYLVKLLHPKDFETLYLPQWSNALCEKRKELDVLAVGAFDGGRLVGLAGCSADCDTMWQIGVDVLEPYRHRGIAAALTSTLAVEILNRGKIPFYCCAWSNLASARNAIKSGFRPAWVQVTAKKTAFIEEMNRISRND